MNNPPELRLPQTHNEALDFSEAHTGAGELGVNVAPDALPWNLAMAFFVWVASVAMIVIVPSVLLLVYAFAGGVLPNGEQLAAIALSPSGIIVQVLANFPAHLLTLAMVWLVVTGAGRRPFWKTIRWTWMERATPLWWWLGTAVMLWVASSALTQLLIWMVGAKETAFDRLIESSPPTRIALAVLAVLTAPLVEEIVYRGVLYPAFERAISVKWAIIGVAGLFTLVHMPQYWNNPGIIVGLAFLSVALTIVRARTGSVLPCFIIHFVFNAISATLLVLEPMIKQPEPKPPPTTEIVNAVLSLIASIQI